MAVNYLSRPVETTPYVLPVSLELLAKVNSYKQTQFYQNAQKVNDMLGTLAGTDIANPTQKAYLDDAINSITNKINSNGALDYSDLNVTNSIENLGTEIYKDDNIMNGIASTKRMRQIQSNYQKMANDPKLNKYYSQAYETYDYEHYIKPYISSDNLKASYDGPTNPTIYTGNPLEKAAKLIKQAKPEIINEIVNGQATGGYINVQTKERYTPETLVSAFDSVIDGQTKTELVKNAWYTLDYSNRKADGTPVYDENGYAKMLSDQSQNTLDNLEAELKANNEAILSAGLDPNVRKQIEQTVKLTQQKINNLKASRADNDAAFRNVFRKDKDAALYQLYVGGLKNDLYKIFGAEQTKLSLKPDLERLQKWKQDNIMLAKGFEADGLNADGTPRYKAMKDAKVPLDIKTDFSIVDINVETADEAATHELSIAKLDVENSKVYGELNAATFEYIKNAAMQDTALWDALQFKSQVTNDANSAPYTTSSVVLNKIAQGDNNKILTIEDLERVIKNKDQADAAGLSPKAVTFIQGVVNSYEKLVRGVDNDQPIDKETRNFMNIYKDKLSIVNSNKKLVADITAKVIARDKLNTVNIYDNPGYTGSPALRIPSQLPKSQDGTLSEEDFYRIKRQKIATKQAFNTGIQSKITEAVNKELKAVSNRENYFSIVLRGETDKFKVENYVPGLRNLTLEQNKEGFNTTTYKPETINYTKLTKSPDGWRVSFTVENKKGELIYSAPNKNVKGDLKDITLTNEQAQKLGAQILPYEGLEREAYVNGVSERDHFIPTFKNIKTDGTVAKNAKPTKIQIWRTNDTRNNNNYIAKVYIPSLNDWKVIPYKQGDERYATTANSAYYYATSILEDYSIKSVGNWGIPAADENGNVITIKNAETFYKDIILQNQNN